MIQRNLVHSKESAAHCNLNIFREEGIDYSAPGISVGIATDYGLNGPGIESRYGRDLPHLSRPALVPTQPPVQWISGIYRG
jgi:hypothetical protein